MENIDAYDASGLLVPGGSEDSVDIYDGLDTGLSSNAERSPPNSSQLKESMDLYEEIVTEEQRSKETSYTELQSRFQAAQNQIKELRRRLEQMEMQNTGLNTENCRLKKNISALLRTARQEVTRKDAEIQRLNQRSDKGHHHHHHPPPPPPPFTPAPPPLHLPKSPPRENQHPRDPAQSSRTESNSSANQPFGSCTEKRASKASSHIHSKNPSRGDCEIPDKQTEHSVSKCSSTSSTQHSDSDKHKSKHREEKYQHHKVCELAERRPRTGSHPSKDCHAPEKNRSHKADRDTGRKYDSRSGKSRIYPNVEGHHSSDRTRSPPPKVLHSAASSDDMKGRSRERRREKAKLATSDSEQSTACSSKEGYSRDHRRIKTNDGHDRRSDSKDRKKSSSNQHAERYSDSSKEREGERSSKDHQRKEERRHEDDISRKHKKSTGSKMSRDCEKPRSKESDQGKVDVCSKERQGKTHEALKSSAKQPRVTEKSSVEEKSPNRKLCFMETLNLTLSPIKKPLLPIAASQEDLTPVDKGVHKQPGGEKVQSHVEDMCVIEEADSSELEAGLEDVAERAPDIPKESSSEKTPRRCDDAKNDQDKSKNRNGTAGGKLREDSPVQTPPAHRQHLDAVERQVTVQLTPKLPENSSLKATEEDKSKSLASDSQADQSEPLKATNRVNDTILSKQATSNPLQKVNPGNNTEPPAALPGAVMPESRIDRPKTAGHKSFPMGSFEERTTASPSRETPVVQDGNPKSKGIPPTILPRDLPPASCSSIHKKEARPVQDGPKGTDAVSSTISLDSLPQEGLSLPEAIYVLTQKSEEVHNSSSTAAEPSSSTGCIGVSKVSSTTEETALPEKFSDLTFTPKKSFTPGKSPETNVEPSSSFPLLHDEDSMMCTLSNLKRIPDAISPLRSPIRITRRGHLHAHGKPNHVKSLQKDFSSTAVDVNSKRLDVNKENKYPGSPANHDMQNMVDKLCELRSSLSDTDLEEGEILSESDEVATDSPGPANKRAKLAQSVRSKPNPKSVLKRKSEERCPGENKETSETTAAAARSPKSRFKTVCPAATKASFSNIEEIMETFKLVRTEIRKKYMKLHKTFPKKSFFGMMDNFQESFLEFVDGAHFGQICSQAEDLKSKLKKLIASVFSKVSNNGIVKRIFEQQAVDLKQKLWDFVDLQVDYLFRDIHTALSSLCRAARAPAEDKRPRESERASRQKEAASAPPTLTHIKPCAVVPYRTGLGSRGKDIRITHAEKDGNTDPHPADCPNTQIDFLPPKSICSTPEKSSMASLVASQSGSLLDKPDFELLTEQQASSLTFNLVRDSQMGEIFKCLLQGSDLLESSGVAGESTAWSLSTPRKDGERHLSITTPSRFDSPSKLLSPTRFNTPSKLITTWSGISPRKMSSPRPKELLPLSPALFDESCLLEVPSENRAALQSSLAQRSYSILTEDLAVSLTIPSPLKSDSHLSFLQPASVHLMSTPDSVISAHISEDALMDGEDATEQDIHLALDTDNSSCGSSSSVASVALTTSFLFKPDVPMQALVMEKSNDHFIVKIRQSSTRANITLTADESLSQTLTEDDQLHREEDLVTHQSQTTVILSERLQSAGAPSHAAPPESSLSDPAEISGTRLAPDQSLTLTLTKDSAHEEEHMATQQRTSKFSFSEESHKLSPKKSLKHQPVKVGKSPDPSQPTTGGRVPAEGGDSQTQKSPSKALFSESQKMISPSKSVMPGNSPHHPTRSEAIESPESERNPVITEDMSSSPETDRGERDKGRKRKKHHDKFKSKRSRTEEVESPEEMAPKKEDEEFGPSPACLSPNSLSAKNVVRKKGEVVMAWTRDEDRSILIALKTKGASRETFSALSEKLSKPSEQIAHRFYQLMKLFKRQEKMDA